MRKILLVLCMCLFISIMFVSCAENNGTEPNTDTPPDTSLDVPPDIPHTCVFDKKVEDSAFLKSEASCTQRKSYYFSCSCGKAGSEFFLAGGYGHVLENGECVVDACDYRESVGLHMSTTNNSTAYSCYIGNCTDQHVIIPEYYNDLPIVEVNLGGSAWKHAETVTIPKTVVELDYANDGGYVIPRIYYEGGLIDWLNVSGDSISEGFELYIDGELITDLVIPDGISEIKNYIFYNWRWLKSIHIPASVTYIGECAFSGSLGNLESITVAEGNTKYRSSGNCLIENDTVILGCNTSIIPNDGSVTRIGRYAFKNCDGLRTVELPDSIEDIGSEAFAYCDGLKSITGLGVKSCEESAFYSCTLKKYTFHPNFSVKIWTKPSTEIGENDIRVGDYIFRIVDDVPTLVGYVGTENNLTLPADYEGNVYVIGERAFYKNDEIYQIVIPDTVERIGSEAFSQCDFLFNVTLGSGLTEIADDAFDQSYRLVEIYNRSSLTVDISTYGLAQALNIYDFEGGSFLHFTEDGYVFYLGYYHTYLLGYVGDKVHLNLPTPIPTPDGYLQSFDALRYYTIHDYAFYECNNIVSIDAPALVAFLGKYAFYGCDSLQEIEFHGNIMGIGDKALVKCPELKILHLPSSLANVGENAIDVDSLVALYFDGDIDDWAKINFSSPLLQEKYGKDYRLDKLYINGIKASSFKDIVISDDVKIIGSYSFADWDNLETVNTGNGVLSIEKGAFYNTYLDQVTVGTKVLTIYDEAFHTVDVIMNFSGLNIVKGAIQEHGGIGRYADIVTRKPTIVKGDFIFVVDTEDTYHLIEYTGTQTVLVLPDDCDGHDYLVYRSVFSGLPIESVSIGEGVTEIGSGAFYKCNKLTTINLSSSLISIGDHAFSLDTGWYEGEIVKTTVNAYIDDVSAWLALWGDSGHSAFAYRDISLIFYINGVPITDLTVPEGTTSIPEDAFFGCTGLTSITIPDSVTSIGAKAFYGCTGLTSITIPESVVSIGSNAFEGCANLTSIIIPANVTVIDKGMFEGCTNLIQIESGVSYVDKWIIACDPTATGASLRPDTIGIGVEAFKDCEELTEIIIPDSVRSIGSSAFKGCTKLDNVTVPFNVTSIGSGAFSGCANLTTITLPFVGNQLNETTNEYFADVFGAIPSSLRTVVITGGESIGDNAFSGCTNLTSITIPESVVSIGSNAFEGCANLTSITLPSSVTSIGFAAFKDCTSLESITLPFVGNILNGTTNTHFGYVFGAKIYSHNWGTVPSSLKTIVITGGEIIDSYAFYECTGITCITLPSTVTSSGAYTFSGCTSLETVNFADGWQCLYIGDRMFENCTSLTNIEIPSSVTSIGRLAFYNCLGLTSITIPDSVTSIGSSAFRGCMSLESITLPFVGDKLNGGSSYFGVIFGAPTSSQNQNYVPTSLKNVVITKDESIGMCAFRNCTSLKSIILPDSIASIGQEAFYGCTGLTSIKIPSGVTEINRETFYGCTGLTTITLPDGMTRIDGYAFYGCANLTDITIPSTVSIIDANSFSNCTELKSIIIPTSVTYIGSNAFNGCTNLTIYCEVATRPLRWSSTWNSANCPVVWSYIVEE